MKNKLCVSVTIYKLTHQFTVSSFFQYKICPILKFHKTTLPTKPSYDFAVL